MSATTMQRCTACLTDATSTDAEGYCPDCVAQIRAELRHRALRAAAHHLYEANRMKHLAREYGAAEIEIEHVVPFRDADFDLTVEGL